MSSGTEINKIKPSEIVLMVEIDAKEDLKNSVVDVNALVRTLVPS